MAAGSPATGQGRADTFQLPPLCDAACKRPSGSSAQAAATSAKVRPVGSAAAPTISAKNGRPALDTARRIAPRTRSARAHRESAPTAGVSGPPRRTRQPMSRVQSDLPSAPAPLRSAARRPACARSGRQPPEVFRRRASARDTETSGVRRNDRRKSAGVRAAARRRRGYRAPIAAADAHPGRHGSAVRRGRQGR